MKRQTITALTLFCITALSLGCTENGLAPNETGLKQQDSNNFTLITDDEMYKELHKKRSGEISEEFEITGVSRFKENGNNFLKIEIAHHSCDPETRIVWDGRIAESYPPQIYLFIQLLADKSCTEAEERQEILELNVDKLIDDEYTAETVIIHILNASKQNKDNDHSDNPVNSN